jgi:transcriptional regulator with XRE-family HTH domain
METGSHGLNLLIDNKLDTNIICDRQPVFLVDTGAINCGIQIGMKTLADRLRYSLERKGINESELARRVGRRQQTINFIASGVTENPRNLADIAEALDVDAGWLRYGTGQPDIAGSGSSKGSVIKGGSFPTRSEPQRRGADDPATSFSHQGVDLNNLPVYGTPHDLGDDRIHLDMKEPLSFTGRPPMLLGNPRGFGVFMVGDSMSPRFDHGEMFWVDPVQPAQIGDYVLAVFRDNSAIARQLVASGTEAVTLLARNTDTESSYQRGEIKHLFKIVGSRAL